MTGQRRATIIDVAKRAGVSKSTVSLVLRNSASVREETRDDVRKAMSELGYVYNRAAANMRNSNAGLIGLVINNLRNPFFTEFATSLQMALAARGYAAVVANTDEDAALQAQVVDTMIEHGVSALILCPVYDTDNTSFDAIARAGIPAMQMLRKVDDRLDLFPFSAPDYAEGSRVATEHLFERGAKRVAFVGGVTDLGVTVERQSGYLDVTRAHGAEPLVLAGPATRAFGRSSARALAKSHQESDGVVCFNDLVALGLLSGCHEIGREVGTDIAIVGFDDIEDVAHTYPTLSSIHCDIAKIGASTAARVVAWLEEDQRPAPVERSPVSLNIRESSR